MAETQKTISLVMFQFLIGRLKTKVGGGMAGGDVGEFQFLIGRLKT